MRKLLLIPILLLVGCASLNPFSGLPNTPNPPKKAGSWEQTSKPVFMGTDYKGQSVVGYENTYKASASETIPPLRLSQKIGRWIASLSLAGFLFLVISLLFFGGAPIIWIYGKFLRARSALKRTIMGIEELNAADQKNVKSMLFAIQDTKDKLYIADLKAEIKKDEVIK